jgi:hypothetical protein
MRDFWLSLMSIEVWYEVSLRPDLDAPYERTNHSE